MPFAIRSGDQQYLRVVRSSRGMKRRWVATLEDATTWTLKGHATNALACAVPEAVKIGETVDIVEVRLREHGAVLRVRPVMERHRKRVVRVP